MTKDNISLNSSEMAYLWASSQGTSLEICILIYFQSIVEDTEIKQIVDFALENAQKNVSQINDIFKNENFPIPIGFTEHDVNTEVERLYSDPFILAYLWFIGKTNLNLNSVAINTIARNDVFTFYERNINESLQLLNKARETLLSKGLWLRSPIIPTPDHTEFVKKQGFLNGLFSEKSTLTGAEIAQLFYNSLTNTVGLALMTSFSQVTRTQEIKEYFIRGRKIAQKHIEVLASILRADHILTPAPWDYSVTSSTESPFSEKLMLYFVTLLNSQGISNYGIAISMTMRKDVVLDFARLSAEVAQYSEDGADLLIKNGWMEQQPKAPDRDKLADA